MSPNNERPPLADVLNSAQEPDLRAQTLTVTVEQKILASGQVQLTVNGPQNHLATLMILAGGMQLITSEMAKVQMAAEPPAKQKKPALWLPQGGVGI